MSEPIENNDTEEELLSFEAAKQQTNVKIKQFNKPLIKTITYITIGLIGFLFIYVFLIEDSSIIKIEKEEEQQLSKAGEIQLDDKIYNRELQEPEIKFIRETTQTVNQPTISTLPIEDAPKKETYETNDVVPTTQIQQHTIPSSPQLMTREEYEGETAPPPLTEIKAGIFIRNYGAASPPQTNTQQNEIDSRIQALTQNLQQDEYTRINSQADKQKFIENARNNFETSYIGTVATDPISPYIIQAGSIIPIKLKTGINSSLPGIVIGQVTSNVYDSIKGEYLLIPSGSTTIGSYDSNISFAQKRLLVVWEWLYFPNGTRISLQGMQGVDIEGKAGYTDKIDLHFKELGIAILLSSTLGIIETTSDTAIAGVNNEYLSAVLGGTKNGISKGSDIIGAWADKMINVQPDIIIEKGKEVNILVHKDIILKPYYE